MSFYKTGLRQSKNDVEYDGIECYQKLLGLCQLGDQVSIMEKARGKHMFWLNDHCYTGWGNRGNEIVKAYILADRLPRSFLDHDVEYTWCVITTHKGAEVVCELIPPTDEDGLIGYKAHTYNFLSQHSLSNKFYDNIHKASTSKIYHRAKTFLHRDIRGWKDIVTAYEELLVLSEYAKKMASFGIRTYGCMQRSGTWSPQINKSHAQLKSQLTHSSFNKADGTALSDFLMRELDKRDAHTNPDDTYALMEYAATKIDYLLMAKPKLPTELTEKSLNEFRNLTIDIGDLSSLGFNL